MAAAAPARRGAAARAGPAVQRLHLGRVVVAFPPAQARGLHPLWATALIYLLAVLVISLWRPAQLGAAAARAGAVGLVLASGTTNAAFNWGVTIGDVVRVVLLFYLMPLWAVLLARLLLGERLTPLAGCACCWRWPARPSCCGRRRRRCRCRARWPKGWACSAASPLRSTTSCCGARRTSPRLARALAMFLGGAVVAGAAGAGAGRAGPGAAPPAPAWPWVAGALALGALFLVEQPDAAVRRGAAAGQRHRGGDGHRGAVRQRVGGAAGRRPAEPAAAAGRRADRRRPRCCRCSSARRRWRAARGAAAGAATAAGAGPRPSAGLAR